MAKDRDPKEESSFHYDMAMHLRIYGPLLFYCTENCQRGWGGVFFFLLVCFVFTENMNLVLNLFSFLLIYVSKSFRWTYFTIVVF